MDDEHTDWLLLFALASFAVFVVAVMVR